MSTYTATTTQGHSKDFENMQHAKVFAVRNGNGGTLTDHDLGVTYKVYEHTVGGFFNLHRVNKR